MKAIFLILFVLSLFEFSFSEETSHARINKRIVCTVFNYNNCNYDCRTKYDSKNETNAYNLCLKVCQLKFDLCLKNITNTN